MSDEASLGGSTFVTEPSMAATVGSVIFVVVVVGGMGSLAGAFVASLLIERFAFTYLASGRDLARFSAGHAPSRGGGSAARRR